MLFLLWFSTTVGEGRLWERLRIYSGKLFIACFTLIFLYPPFCLSCDCFNFYLRKLVLQEVEGKSFLREN
jgi:hypothetical protein